MRNCPISVLLVTFLLATLEQSSSGNAQPKIIHGPKKLTRVYIGENVSLTWQYYQPSHVTLHNLIFGIFNSNTRRRYLIKELAKVDQYGNANVGTVYGSKITWAGNLTSSLAVFVLYNVQHAADGKFFGIRVDFGSNHDILPDSVQLQVSKNPNARIIFVSSPPLLWIGQNLSLNCRARGLSPVNVTWYKGCKALATGISEAILTLNNITNKDWGEFLCVANNSLGRYNKSVVLKVRPENPTILNTNRKVENANWTLRWSSVCSERQLVTLYTVWYRVLHVTKDNPAREESWARENVTSRCTYHKELRDNTSYMFAVTAWNRWGESLSERKETWLISTDFSERTPENSNKPTLPVHKESGTSPKPDFQRQSNAILYGVLAAILSMFLAVVICLVRRKQNHSGSVDNINSIGQQDEVTSTSPVTSHDNLALVPAQSATGQRGSSESPTEMQEPSAVLEQPTVSLKYVNEDFSNQPRTEKCFVETTFRSGMKAESPGSTSHDPPSSSRALVSHRGRERCDQNFTFTKTPLSLEFMDKLQNNLLYEETAQSYASIEPTGQSNRAIPQQISRNARCSAIPLQHSLLSTGSGKLPHPRVLSNTDLEVFERIGGGSFSQVWKGAMFDVAGDQKWTDVAVKMLKENSSNSDLKDLLSELDVLKKLKPHPNVIQLLGYLTKDVVRCKGGREFRPPLVILEFVPYGDLLGYLKKSKGETDDYYNLRRAEVPQRIPTQQLYKFASDIARGMEFISAHKLIHRDLAARNVLVGDGLRCKITDFGMARDVGQDEIYVRRSNGLVPVKWMAVESLTSQVFTTESDVWSYAIVLYEIFTLGETPYERMTGEEVFTYVTSGHRLPRTSAMTSELYNFMLQCWQEEPYQRPTFSEIASWTEAVAQDH